MYADICPVAYPVINCVTAPKESFSGMVYFLISLDISMNTSEGGMSRMTCSWDTPGLGGEKGRVRGQRGSMDGMNYQGLMKELPPLARPPLPPPMAAGGHGGSHGPLGNEFITSILEQRKPLIDIASSLNMTAPGTMAHRSALKDGELMKIPYYEL